MKEQKQIKKIEPVEIELEYTEEINVNDYLNKLSNHELFLLEKDFEDSIENLNEAIKTSLDSFVDIGKQIIDLYEKKSYLLYGFKNIYELMQKLYNFSATTTKNYMAIAKRFEYNYDELFDQGYSISQLVEMSSMDDYSNISPKMTIKEIRSFKKEAEIEKRIELHKNSYKDFFNKVAIKLIREDLAAYYHDHEIIEDSDSIFKRLKILLKNKVTNYIIHFIISFNTSNGLYDVAIDPPVLIYKFRLTDNDLVNFLKDNGKRINEEIKAYEDRKRKELEEKDAEQELKKEKLESAEKDDSFLILRNDEERKAYINNYSNWKQIVAVEKVGYIFYEFKREDFPFAIVWNMRRDPDDGGHYYFVRRNQNDYIKQLIIDIRVSESELITFIRDYKTNYGKA